MREIESKQLFAKVKDRLQNGRPWGSARSTKPNFYWAVLSLGIFGCAPAAPIQGVATVAETSQSDASMPAPELQNDQSLRPAMSDAGSSFVDGMTSDLDGGLSATTQDSQLDTNAENDGTTDAEVDMATEPSETLSNQAATIAAELDRLCEADCQRDLACNPAEAESIGACVVNFCGYAMNLDTEAVNTTLLRCFESERDLLACITTLSCEDYVQYYYGDETSVIPCAGPETAYESACAGFFEEEVN